MTQGRLVVGVVVVAAIAHADPEEGARWRAKAQAEIAQVGADACGRRVAARIEWAAFDRLDFKKAGEDKNDAVGLLSSSLESLHDGLANACRDATTKTMMAAIDTIVYVPTDDKSYRLDASVVGTTLTLTDNIFGSTRLVDDFERAIRKAKPPDAPKPAGPVKLGTPSGAWDATYRNEGGPEVGGTLCVRASDAGDIKVAGGKLTIPWRIDDFRLSSPDRHKMLDLGKLEAVVHADGTGVGILKLASPALESTEPRTVKLKRILDTVTSVAFKFFKTDNGRAFTFTVQFADQSPCEYRWEWDDPKIAAARAAAYERAEAAKTPAQRAKERRAAEHKSKCENACDTRHDTCRSRCSDAHSTCSQQCDEISDFDERTYGCPKRCSSAESSCESGCDSDQSQCQSDCSTGD